MTAGSDDRLRVLKAEYDRDGFVVVRGFLSDAEVSELRGRALPLAERMTSQDHGAGKYKNVIKSLHHYDSYLENPASSRCGWGPIMSEYMTLPRGHPVDSWGGMMTLQHRFQRLLRA